MMQGRHVDPKATREARQLLLKFIPDQISSVRKHMGCHRNTPLLSTLFLDCVLVSFIFSKLLYVSPYCPHKKQASYFVFLADRNVC